MWFTEQARCLQFNWRHEEKRSKKAWSHMVDVSPQLVPKAFLTSWWTEKQAPRCDHDRNSIGPKPSRALPASSTGSGGSAGNREISILCGIECRTNPEKGICETCDGQSLCPDRACIPRSTGGGDCFRVVFARFPPGTEKGFGFCMGRAVSSSGKHNAITPAGFGHFHITQAWRRWRLFAAWQLRGLCAF